MNKIKKGDTVIVIAGKDKGKKGIVLSVINKGERFLVEGINLAKKHIKANPNSGERGGIISKPMSIHRSNVMLHDEISKKGSRVGIRTLENGERARYFKTTDQLIDVKA